MWKSPASTGLLAAVLWPRKSVPSNQNVFRVKFSVELPSSDSLGEFVGSSVGLSKNGMKLAYVVNHGTERSIFIRPLDQLEGTSVAGTERGSAPFFSPDGEWLGFAADGKLKKTYSNLTLVTDILLAADGTLYAVQLSDAYGDAGFNLDKGSVVKVTDSGSEVVADNLDSPYGIAQSKDGQLFISTNSLGAVDSGAVTIVGGS